MVTSSAPDQYGQECPPFGFDPPDFPFPMSFSPPLLGPYAPASEHVTFTGEESNDNGGGARGRHVGMNTSL